MASVIRVHIRAARSPTNELRWIDRPGSPAIEARTLCTLIGKNGDTIESLRELISVPPRKVDDHLETGNPAKHGLTRKQVEALFRDKS